MSLSGLSPEGVLSAPDKVRVLDPTIMVRGQLINTGSSGDRSCTVGALSGQLAATPEPGAAMPGGAELDRTIFFDFGWKTGVRSLTASKGQGAKQPALDIKDVAGTSILTNLFSGNLSFPGRLPVTYVKLGSFALGAVPVKMSTTAGYRIRKDMEAGDDIFQLVGLTNAYASCAATPSEYAAQDYMGASTLLGPYEAEFFRCSLTRLRAHEPPPFSFPTTLLGLGDPFGPAAIGQPRDLPDEDMEDIIRDSGYMSVRHLPFFEWAEPVDGDQKYKAATLRSVYVTADNSVVDATDVGFIKVLKQAPAGNCQTWDAIWLGPLLQGASGSNYVFHVKTGKGEMVVSQPFSVDLASTSKPAPVPQLPKQPGCK